MPIGSANLSSVAVIVGLVVWSHIIGTAPACAQLQQAIQIKQAHYFLGDELVTATKDAVRIENIGRFRFIVVARAPDWGINIFRDDDKTYFSESLKEFAETGLVSDFLVARRQRYPIANSCRKSPLTFLGHPAFRMTSPSSSLIYLPLGKDFAQQVESVIYSTYKLPTAGGMPLEVNNTSNSTDWVSGANNKGRLLRYLTTSTISSVKVAPDIFKLPQNYTRAKSVREVVSGADARKESVDAQVLFNSGRDNKKK